jgi:hypothetical protein
MSLLARFKMKEARKRSIEELAKFFENFPQIVSVFLNDPPRLFRARRLARWLGT